MGRGARQLLTGLFGAGYPLSRYRVYDKEDAELVCGSSLFEVTIQLLSDGRVNLKDDGLERRVYTACYAAYLWILDADGSDGGNL